MMEDGKDINGKAGIPGAFGLFLVALLPALNWTVFGTSTIFLDNAGEFDSGYVTLLAINIGLGIGLAAVLAGTGLFLKPSWRKGYACILFAVGLLLWAQGAFLMHDYGVLDGRGINWDAIDMPVWVDLLVWLGVLFTAVVLRHQVVRIAVFGSAVFIVLQGATMTAASINADEGIWNREFKPVSGPPDGIFEYSSSSNIIHIVLDNFQTDVFLELVEEQGLESEFDGFIVFRDNIAVAPHTSLAMPAIFSGRTYDGSVSPNAYYREAMEQGFHNILLDHGYTVNLVPLMSMRQGGYTNYYRLPNLYSGSHGDRIRKDVVRLLDISLFRQTPHLARKWIYNRNNWRLTMWVSDAETVKAFQQRSFFADYIERLEVRHDDPSYHFVHLWPPHPPFTTARSGRYAGGVLANTRENYVNEARPMTALFVELLDRLKALDIYDDSLIILQSDHGGGFEPEFMPTRVLGLLAVKPAGSSGPMRLSDAPTTVADVAQTILKEVGIDQPAFAGQSALEIGKGQRARQFVYLGRRESRMLHSIRIEGSPYSPDSYGPAEAIPMDIGSGDYRYGDLVNVGLAGEGGRYLHRGWSSQADRHCWNNGLEAELSLTVDPPSTDLTLVVDLIPHVHADALPRQRIHVLVNGRQAGQWVAEEPGKQRFEIAVPKDWIAADMLITFMLPDAAIPAELGTGGDQRQLGIALINFQLREQEKTTE